MYEFHPPDDWEKITEGLITFDEKSGDLVIDTDAIERIALDTSRPYAVTLMAVISAAILEGANWGYHEL